MSDGIADDILHLEQLAFTLRRRQRVLETQTISYGTLAVPAHLVLELEDVRRDLARILADLRRLHPGRSGNQAPYVGLLTFQETDTDRFFGRDLLVADLLQHAQRGPYRPVDHCHRAADRFKYRINAPSTGNFSYNSSAASQ